MTTLIACDLDRTLIYTRALIAEFDSRQDDLICVEHYNGAPLSFITHQARALLDTLTTEALVVPTTTRTIAQYERVRLSDRTLPYAITSNGGNILINSAPDLDWRLHMRHHIDQSCSPLAEITAALRHRIDSRWVHDLRVAEDLFCYLIVDLTALPAQFVASWAHLCAQHGWTVSIQGRKIYTMPAVLCKSAAVTELRRRLNPHADADNTTVLAAGDGALDAPMLRMADAAIRPRHGELHTINFQTPTVTITDSAGIAAGEEILQWMLGRIRQARLGTTT